MKLLVEKYPNGYEEPNTKFRTADRKVETPSQNSREKNKNLSIKVIWGGVVISRGITVKQ